MKSKKVSWAILILMALAGLLLLILAGTTWKVIPPENVEEAAHVFITQYASHTRLTIPLDKPIRAVEYGFGDWWYYAVMERGLRSGLRALFLPTDSAISRRVIPWGQSLKVVQQHLGGARTEAIAVDSSRLTKLRAKFEDHWHSLDAADEVLHPGTGTVYRRTKEPYHIMNNSNARTADWLRTLDCEINGLSLTGNFIVE